MEDAYRIRRQFLHPRRHRPASPLFCLSLLHCAPGSQVQDVGLDPACKHTPLHWLNLSCRMKPHSHLRLPSPNKYRAAGIDALLLIDKEEHQDRLLLDGGGGGVRMKSSLLISELLLSNLLPFSRHTHQIAGRLYDLSHVHGRECAKDSFQSPLHAVGTVPLFLSGDIGNQRAAAGWRCPGGD